MFVLHSHSPKWEGSWSKNIETLRKLIKLLFFSKSKCNIKLKSKFKIWKVTSLCSIKEVTNLLKIYNSLFEVFPLNNDLDNNFKKLLWFSSFSVNELSPFDRKLQSYFDS